MKFPISSFLAAIILATSISANAKSLTFEGDSASLWSSPGDSPKPIPPPKGSSPVPIGGFNFAKGKALWDRSSMPTEDQLISNWKMIGYADVDWEFAQMKDQYNTNGISNSDSSVLTLRFAKPTTDSQEAVLSAEFLSWGSKDKSQGPYESSIDTQKQAAIASVYGGGGKTLTYFRLDCRISPNSSDQLVCALTLKVDPSERSSYPNQVPYDNVQGGVAVFKRAN